MTGFQLALALEGSLLHIFQRGASKPTRNAAHKHGRGGTQKAHSSKRIAAQKSSLSPPRINWEKKQKLHNNQIKNFLLHNNKQRHDVPPTRNAAQQHGRGDHAKFAFVQANCCPKTMLANLGPNWEKNTQYTTINLTKIRLKPLHVLHGRVMALSKDEIIGEMTGGGDIQSQYDKAIEMAPDGGMLFDAAADDYSS